MQRILIPVFALLSAMNASYTIASERLDAILDQAVAYGDVPGVVAMVASAERVLYARAAGLADVSRQRPMQTDTVFRIASMTKPLTSVALMQLVEQRKVNLDAPMSEYLDSFEPRAVLLDVNEAGPVYSEARYTPTIRQLLSHTSGFGYSVWNDRLFRTTDFAKFSPTYFMGEPLVFEPGTTWHYSTSTDWVGLIVERVSGQTLEAYLSRGITSRLGMRETAFNIDAALQERLATHHRREAQGTLTEVPNPVFEAATFFSGGGGLHATAPDYLRFMQMILRDGGNEERVLTSRSVAAMSRNQIGDLEVAEMQTSMPSMSNDFDVFPRSKARFGLGFLINETDIPGRRRSGSLTWAGLYNTYFWIDPESNVCAVLMTQVLPFYDEAVVTLLAEFETAVYATLVK